MKALILAAGYGTRLYALVKDTPKPLLPVAKKPLINHILEKIGGLPQLETAVVVTNNKFYSHFVRWAQENKNFPVPLQVINDGSNSPDDRLGSVGDIVFALDHGPIDEDLLVLGGDNLFDYSLEDYVAFAKVKRPSLTIGLYDIGNLAQATKFGVAQVDQTKKIISFEEKPASPKSSLAAMCCYYMPRESLHLIGQYLLQGNKADRAGDYIRWLVEHATVFGFQFRGKWYDIGSVESYHEAQERFS